MIKFLKITLTNLTKTIINVLVPVHRCVCRVCFWNNFFLHVS